MWSGPTPGGCFSAYDFWVSTDTGRPSFLIGLLPLLGLSLQVPSPHPFYLPMLPSKIGSNFSERPAKPGVLDSGSAMEQPRAWTGVVPVRMKEPISLAETSAAPVVATDFDSVVHEYARFVFKVAYSVLRNVEDAEDSVQETFLRAYRSSELQEVRDMKAWLARIAWRVAIDRAKKAPTSALEDLAETGFEPQANNVGADESMIAEERVTILHRLIVTLPDDLKHAMVLSTVEEMTSAEIAQVLGIPETSVRTRLFRARQLLKEKLASWMEGKNGR